MIEDQVSIMNRREFIGRIGTAGAVLSMALAKENGLFAKTESGGKIELPALPYAQDALAPYISEKTLGFHYGKHHQGYVTKTLNMIAGTEFEGASLEEIIKKTAVQSDMSALFNNAAQVFNHSFYWNSMKPQGGGEPRGKIAGRIRQSFGDYGKFVEAFSQAAASQFGSGWAWLVQEKDALKIIKTANADTPVAHGLKPLLTIDVWEHAYYLDYQNRRPDYIKAFLDSLVNWDFAEQNLD